LEEKPVGLAERVKRAQEILTGIINYVSSSEQSPCKHLVESEVASEVDRIDDLNKRIVGHACLSYTNERYQHLGVRLQLPIVYDSSSYKNQTEDRK
jgi:hypothetical protein